MRGKRPKTTHQLILLAIMLVGPLAARAQDPIADWRFFPNYTLGGKASNTPGPVSETPNPKVPLVEIATPPMLFQGQSPTERIRHLLPANRVPRETFAVEMWMCHHINQPVAALVTVRGKKSNETVPWSVSFQDWEATFRFQADQEEHAVKFEMKPKTGFKKWWVHIVATYNGHNAKLYANGKEVGSLHLHDDDIAWPKSTDFELSAYMKNEPFMQWSNLVNRVRIYDTPLSAEQVDARFQTLSNDVEQGIRFEELFHFTAGPYLNLATENSMSLTWETDRPSTSKLQWGESAKLGNELSLQQNQRLQEATIEKLEPNSPYFYRITATDKDGKQIDSGLLTFKTAVSPGQPFRFAVMGDTESRPHINDRLSKLIWGERPHFLINLGDLTDGGKKDSRFEWTHEYFVGMTQLASRVPVFAVPGNGESDLYWYKHYHRYPTPEGYYQFQYGDATFFMLDSNQREKEFRKGGKQYQWLDEQLAKCESKWKFACHHHATYTSEEDDYGNTWQGKSHFGDPAVQQIVPIYEKHNVDMVMFGHLHLYERSLPLKEGKVTKGGTIHLLAGGGGGNLEDFSPSPAFFSAKVHRGHHYLMMELVGNRLTLRMHDINGAIRDTFAIEKTSDAGKLKTTRVE